MSEHPNLASALAAFQSEMPTVGKDKRANIGAYSYTYADLASIVEATMPLLTKHGLSFSCGPRYASTGYELRGVLLHASGETIDGALPIKGNTPQEIGSSLTYMRRYLFGCLTGVVTEDDDDGAAASRPAKKAASRQAPPRQEEPPPPPPEQGGAELLPPYLVALQAAFTRAGIKDRAEKLAYCHKVLQRDDITTSRQLSRTEVGKVLDALGEGTG